ncbi:PP-loop family-domain-containing protein [Cercophora scortea]|uniref:tRNA(Ile)-lysidine synthetase n=1 Tax=Cercophora scortea TaxID=314031 RepID=A0AAE0IAQ4_9PEZI|nr:PP-loop family-domain-containing protein [Cercophora scortea]
MATATAPRVFHHSARAITAHEFLDAVNSAFRVRSAQPQPQSLPVALAVSGGVDSMALAFLCSSAQKGKLASNRPVSEFRAVVIDHGLREGSAEEASKVCRVLETMGVSGRVLQARWDEKMVGSKHVTGSPNELPNMETMARQVRYRALGRYCRGERITSLLAAHHEDDQYETVLMRLLSGHGYRGLQGMRAATDIPECYDLHGIYQSGAVDSDQLGDYGGKGRFASPMPMDIEDGGVTIYRPLLHFSKERLIATCVENGIPWFEDHTNADSTLTMRNAVRHMLRKHTLPVALRKPAVLQLAARCKARVVSEEAEADRVLNRAIFHFFEPSAGTLLVEMPSFTVPKLFARSALRRERRIEHYRCVAALVIRKLLSVVTPERDLTPVGGLDYLISLMFPSLFQQNPPLKPYVICSAHFIPQISPGKPVRWFITRAPHVSNIPRPAIDFPKLDLGQDPCGWEMPDRWGPWRMFDGRYWVRVRHRLPFGVRIAPFEKHHQKAFREALKGQGEGEAEKLAALLKRFAPAKVRYTLPAVYVTGDVRGLLSGDGKGALIPERILEEVEVEEMQLVGLPTLGIGLPGIDQWLMCEVRYRRVEGGLLRRMAVREGSKQHKMGKRKQR